MESPADVDRLHAIAVEHGMIMICPRTNEPGGVREFHLRHPDGHTFRISAGRGADVVLTASRRRARLNGKQ